VKLSPDLVRKFSSIQLAVFDFDGVFTDNRVWINEKGEESVACYRGDGIGLNYLKEKNIPIWVISSEINPVVKMRCEKLKIECIHGCEKKLLEIKRINEALDISRDQTMFVGNDVNDLECLAYVGLAVTVGDAHPDLNGLSQYQTYNPGGHGAVREVCDLLVTCKKVVG